MLEIPVQFFAISPEQVRRTSILDGLRALLVAVGRRVRRPREAPGAESLAAPAAPEPAGKPQAWTES
jgi:hypothetical protein